MVTYVVDLGYAYMMVSSPADADGQHPIYREADDGSRELVYSPDDGWLVDKPTDDELIGATPICS